VTERSALTELARYASIPLPARPLLVPWVQPVEVGDGLLELRSDETFYPLRHPALATAFRAVDDRLTGAQEVEAVLADLPSEVESAAVLLLKMLRFSGLLLDGSELDDLEADERGRLLSLSHLTVRPAAVQRRLTAAAVAVLGSGAIAGRVEEQLESIGCEQVGAVEAEDLDDATAVDLLIACVDAPARSHLTLINAFALERRLPLLRVAAHGASAWLGPLVVPGETACLHCLQTRERANTHGEGALPDFELGSIGALEPQVELLAAQAVAEAIRFLGRATAPSTIGNVYELSATSPQTHRHTLLRDPGCRACGGSWLGSG